MKKKILAALLSSLILMNTFTTVSAGEIEKLETGSRTTIETIKSDYDFLFDYGESKIKEYYKFRRNDDLTKMTADVYTISGQPLWVRITDNGTYDSKKMSEILGEEIDSRFSMSIGVDIDENQHVYKYSDEIDYDVLYSISEVNKIEMVKFIYKSTIYKNVFDHPVIDELGEDPEHTELNSIRIFASPETELNKEMFSNLDTEVVYVNTANEMHDGLKLWLVCFRFRGDYSIFRQIADVVKSYDEKSYGKMCGYTEPCAPVEIAEYVEYSRSGSTGSDEQDKLSAGDDAADANISADEMLNSGDINSDGIVDVTDLSELSLALIGDRTLTEVQQKAADVTGDGEVKLADLAKFKQYLSKQIESLG